MPSPEKSPCVDVLALDLEQLQFHAGGGFSPERSEKLVELIRAVIRDEVRKAIAVVDSRLPPTGFIRAGEKAALVLKELSTDDD